MDESQIREKLDEGWIRSSVIIEVMGLPVEHVESTLKLVLEHFREEKGLVVVSEVSHPAEENKEKLFSTFAEIDCMMRDFIVLNKIVFDYMPASIEITHPNDFRLPALEVSDFVNDTLGLLHSIDFKLKDSSAKRSILEKNSANLMKNFVLLCLKDGGKSISELSLAIGVKADQLEPFLLAFSKEGMIVKNGELWEKK